MTVVSKRRPFFSYYGGKLRIAGHYPRPGYGTIIEPFAGGAGYSIWHYMPGMRVRLYDTDPVIVGVWDYLIHASPRDVLRLPDVPTGCRVKDLDLIQEAKWLIGFWINPGSATPKQSPTKRSLWGPKAREAIAAQIPLLSGWSVECKSWEDIPDGQATWFVDPPYCAAGRYYRHGSNSIDYQALADWCRGRDGQVIVCEQLGADWLPFSGLRDIQGSRKRSTEAVWVRGDRCLP